MDVLSEVELDWLMQPVRIHGDNRLWIVTEISGEILHRMPHQMVVHTLDYREKRVVTLKEIIKQDFRKLAKRYAATSGPMRAANLILNERKFRIDALMCKRRQAHNDRTYGHRECRHARKRRQEKQNGG